jgi:hypothetical protein
MLATNFDDLVVPAVFILLMLAGAGKVLKNRYCGGAAADNLTEFLYWIVMGLWVVSVGSYMIMVALAFPTSNGNVPSNCVWVTGYAEPVATRFSTLCQACCGCTARLDAENAENPFGCAAQPWPAGNVTRATHYDQLNFKGFSANSYSFRQDNETAWCNSTGAGGSPAGYPACVSNACRPPKPERTQFECRLYCSDPVSNGIQVNGRAFFNGTAPVPAVDQFYKYTTVYCLVALAPAILMLHLLYSSACRSVMAPGIDVVRSIQPIHPEDSSPQARPGKRQSKQSSLAATAGGHRLSKSNPQNGVDDGGGGGGALAGERTQQGGTWGDRDWGPRGGGGGGGGGGGDSALSESQRPTFDYDTLPSLPTDLSFLPPLLASPSCQATTQSVAHRPSFSSDVLRPDASFAQFLPPIDTGAVQALPGGLGSPSVAPPAGRPGAEGAQRAQPRSLAAGPRAGTPTGDLRAMSPLMAESPSLRAKSPSFQADSPLSDSERSGGSPVHSPAAAGVVRRLSAGGSPGPLPALIHTRGSPQMTADTFFRGSLTEL